MAKKNIADKYWIYGEDAELAAVALQKNKKQIENRTEK